MRKSIRVDCKSMFNRRHMETKHKGTNIGNRSIYLMFRINTKFLELA